MHCCCRLSVDALRSAHACYRSRFLCCNPHSNWDNAKCAGGRRNGLRQLVASSSKLRQASSAASHPPSLRGPFGLLKNIFKNDLTNAIKHAIVIYMDMRRLPSLPAGVGLMAPSLAPVQQTATPLDNLRGGGCSK